MHVVYAVIRTNVVQKAVDSQSITRAFTPWVTLVSGEDHGLNDINRQFEEIVDSSRT